jgi:hypothetical protein
MRTRSRTAAHVCISVAAAVFLSGCGDQLNIGNGSGADVGILLDGQDSAGAVNDRGFVTVAAALGVGKISSGAASNEVIGFTSQRPPRYLATAWTTSNDSFPVAFNPRIEVPVTVWIIKGPFNAQRDHAIEACIRTSAIWRDERMGVEFSTFQVIDATGDPQAANHFAFPNGDVGDTVWKPLRDDIGFTAGRINIYWVDTVNGATTSGWSNFGAQIAMGRNTGDELLSHEIGHAFSLTHTDGNANFDVNNVMASASNTRQFLTEGQLFRAHLNPTSGLNALYNARPGELTRSCSFGDATPICPSIFRRLWADGAFPAN